MQLDMHDMMQVEQSFDEMQQRARTEGDDILMVSSSISWSSQHDISRHYIRAAAMYTRKCAEIERMYVPGSLTEDSEAFDELYMEYKAHAISSVIFATEFLEAAINKILVDAEDFIDSSSSEYPAWQGVKDNWAINKHTPNTSEILRKFDVALTSARNPGLVSKRLSYQDIHLLSTFTDVDLLINLRNAYIHYIPKWRTVLFENLLVEEVDEKKIDALRMDSIQKKEKFPLSQLLPVGSTRPFFPEKCLGHGCAAWAVNASMQFADEFYKEMNKAIRVPNPLDSIRHRLRTIP